MSEIAIEVDTHKPADTPWHHPTFLSFASSSQLAKLSAFFRRLPLYIPRARASEFHIHFSRRLYMFCNSNKGSLSISLGSYFLAPGSHSLSVSLSLHLARAKKGRGMRPQQRCYQGHRSR
jgi:hypothetical protein